MVYNILLLYWVLVLVFFFELLLTDIMEAKGRVCGLKYFTGVSDTPHPIADKQREEAVVAVAEMACFGELKDIIMYGYVSGYPNGYSNAFNFCLSAELTATAAPATAATKFDNNIVECGFEFGTGVPIATDIVDCFEGNEFGTHVPSITGIINCFVKTERERECKNADTVSANIISNFCEREEECGFSNGISKYGLQAPDGVLFATLIFDYCGFNGNVIVGLTAIAIAVATTYENENSGVLIAPNETNIERQACVRNIAGVCFCCL